MVRAVESAVSLDSHRPRVEAIARVLRCRLDGYERAFAGVGGAAA